MINKIHLLLALLIFLIKNPAFIYQIFHTSYKFLYIFAVVIAFGDFVLYKKNVFLKIKGIKVYFVFFYISIIMVLLAWMNNGNIHPLLTIQFIMNIAQYFLILHLIIRLVNPVKLLDIFYRVVTIVAFLSLGTVACNAVGWFPFPAYLIPFAASRSGTTYFYFPFGMSPYPLPVPMPFYRSYGIFLEPSYLAFTTIPFIFMHFINLKKLKIRFILSTS